MSLSMNRLSQLQRKLCRALNRFLNFGSHSPTSVAIMAITTSSSISVNAMEETIEPLALG